MPFAPSRWSPERAAGQSRHALSTIAMLPLITGIAGTALTAEEAELFSRYQPAGYILFSRNIADYEEVRELTDALRRLTEGPFAPIIAIDQEGGRVVRTGALGVQLPSAAALAATQSEHTITQAALYTARCLQTLGVNTDLAPVLDLASSRANALSGRCWGCESQGVISHAGVWNRTLTRRGILTCGKHFPGMGGAQVDPHFGLPTLSGTCDDFLAEPTVPFTALMPELPSLMLAHLMLPQVDAALPTSLSPAMITQFLRRQLGYEGVVFTDDLCMGAITERYTPAQAAALALQAGCDAPLICHNVAEHLEPTARALGALPPELLADAQQRLERFRLLIPEPLPPMTFLEWREYVADVRSFCARVPEPAEPAPDSPVQHY